MEINFSKKKIVIIGGSGKIGQQITHDFSKSGGNVLVIDTINKFRNKKNIYFKKLKINTVLNLELKLKKILNNFGCPDILINCSYPKSKGWNKINFDKIGGKEISKNVELHQNSYILISILVANLMKKKSVQGSIINLNSIYGLKAQNSNTYKNTPMRENAIYSSIKGSLSALTWSMASHYGKYNIRVNSLCPGGVFNNKKDLKELNKTFFKNYINRTPIKRMCTSKDISNAAIFLSSDFANYITGVNLPIDGGFTIS
tara:strand:- start:4168 stop:4941 length:774 start_codon:yes stop_codon:yes gene_type:complete